MQYREYGKLGFKVSAFGMGCMRLPSSVDNKGNKTIHREEAIKMIRYAADHGVNYFDSAHVYFDGDCDRLLGEALSGGYRERVKVVSKIPPGHVNSEEDFFRILDEQLEKLQTDHLDVLLAHNLGKESFAHLKKINMVSMMEKAKAQGKIKAIACSFHDDFDTYKEVIDYYPWDMSQIQMNILDVNNQATVEGMKYAAGKGIAIVIMEPLRGGGLANPPEPIQEIYRAFPDKRSPVEWAFRFMYNFPEVSCILSGVFTMEQLQDNIRIFEQAAPNVMSAEELAMIDNVRDTYKKLIKVPCTGCSYCVPCPKGVNIPSVFELYNDGAMYGGYQTVKERYDRRIDAGNDASRCVQCGACQKKCPQHIPIIEMLKQAHEAMTNL